ncbi:hypothetical protein F0U61_31255 [Archangium violaceum]|uniref:SAV_2336 N-terminal domain-related protein n=1 Tax=Archangium violaceum TaxID=83451 RepID=UPI002B290CD2|nr:hypothetical protein F0U61_31255 [Archangium violaceum]
MISRLIDTLCAAGLELDAQQVAEILWFARFLSPEPVQVEPVGSSDSDRDASETPRQLPLAQLPEARTGLPPESPSPPEVEVGMPRHEPHVPTRRGGRMVFRSPGAPALPNPLQLGRALRPLRRRRDSHWQREIDEVATAERIAREGLWRPVLRPARSRWLELELVIDTGRSMAIWRKTLSELRTLLRYVGVFRDVRTWSLVTEDKEGKVRLYRGIAGAAHRASEREPRELIGTPAERRLVLVVSDCVSPAWHSGAVGELLRLWGRSSPVAILQMLPQRVWVRTALRHYPSVWVHGREPGGANGRLVFGSWPGAVVPGVRGAVPVPAITLERESFSSWAHVVAGRAGAWAPGVLLRVGGSSARQASVRAHEAVVPLERVQRFESMASPMAQRLMQLFAAVPLSLPVMRLVGRTRLPEASQVHLAEVFLSGLLEEIGPPGGTADPEQVQYDFPPGVREILLASVPLAESLDILQSVSRYVEERLGQALDFQAMLAEPTAFGGEQFDESLRPFARVAATVLRQLGGEYADLATRLERLPPEQQGRGTHARAEVPAKESLTQAAQSDTTPEQPPVAPRWQASGKRVLVLGTRLGTLPNALRWLCGMLGQTLARRGHALVVGGWPGVEQEVGAAYVETLRELGGDPEQHFTQVVSTGRKPVLDVGNVLLTRGGKRRLSAALQVADVVVLLQGEGEIFQEFEAARASSKPVLPLTGTGGDAAKAYKSVMGDLSFRWRSGLSRRSLLRLDAPVSTVEQAGHVVDAVSLLIDRLHPNAQVAPYASAMLGLIQTVEFGAFLEIPFARRPKWSVFIRELERAAGGVRPPLARLTLEPGHKGASVTLGDTGSSIEALRATLPAMTEKLLEDFERISGLEEYSFIGWRFQSGLAPLVLEFAGRDGLDAVGDVVSRASAPRESPFIVSLIDAVKERSASPAEFAAWFSAHVGLSPEELEFRKEFHRVAERLGDAYNAVRGHSPEEVDSTLFEIVRESSLISINRAELYQFPWMDDVGASVVGRRKRVQDVVGTANVLDTIVVPPNPGFVRHFLFSEHGFHRATAYLLIQYYVSELLSELSRSISDEHFLSIARPDEWTSVAVNRLFACLLYRRDDLVLLETWSDIRNELVQFLDGLRSRSLPRTESALLQLMERVSEIVREVPTEPQEERPAEDSPWRWSGKWVVVAGTGSVQLPEQIEQVCRALGEGLARRGHGLIGGGWPGVDRVVAEAYLAALRSLGVNPGEFFVQVVADGELPELKEGTIERARPEQSFTVEVSKADVVVLIGGANGTIRRFEVARFMGKPALPLRATGDDAQTVYEFILDDSSYLLRAGLSRRTVHKLGGSLSSEEDLHHTVDAVLEIVGRIPSVSTAYARTLLALVGLVQPNLFKPHALAGHPKWSAFLGQLARQAGVEFPENAQAIPEFVIGLVYEDQSEAREQNLVRLAETTKERLETTLSRMSERLIADFEQVTELERHDSLGYPIQTALARFVARSQGSAGLEAIGRVMHRAFDGLPSPFITELLTEAQRHFPSEEQYRAWVARHLGISPQEYEFRQTIYRLSLGLQLRLTAEHVQIKEEMVSLREALPANVIAREPAFIRFFLGEERPALQRALAYLLIEEFQFASLLPELLRALRREHRRMNEPHAGVAIWQLLSCLGEFWAEPHLEELWPQISSELGALRKTLEEQPMLDPSGEIRALLRSFLTKVPPRQDLAQNEEGHLTGDALRARGELDGALNAYRAELDVAQRSARGDPLNPYKRRQILLKHFMMGRVYREKGDLDRARISYESALDVARTQSYMLDSRTPTYEEFQRDQYLAYSSIGDILREKGDFDEALAAYQSGLDFAQRLAERKPNKITLQRDLFLSHYSIGYVLRSSGDLEGALTAFQSAVNVAQRMVEREPNNETLQHDLSVSRQSVDGVLRALERLP